MNLEHCAKYGLIGCLPCRVSDHCKTISKREVNHYHCSVCQKTIRQKQNFTIHLENHKKQQFNEKRKFKKERRFSDTENKEQETENDVAEAYQEKFDYETKTILSNKVERVQCSRRLLLVLNPPRYNFRSLFSVYFIFQNCLF